MAKDKKETPNNSASMLESRLLDWIKQNGNNGKKSSLPLSDDEIQKLARAIHKTLKKSLH